jgi:hypothetical protein
MRVVPDNLHQQGPSIVLCLSLLVIFVASVPSGALGNGGTNMHELSASPAVAPSERPTLPSERFSGCGRGRYRDARTHKCRGPADFGN